MKNKLIGVWIINVLLALALASCSPSKNNKKNNHKSKTSFFNNNKNDNNEKNAFQKRKSSKVASKNHLKTPETVSRASTTDDTMAPIQPSQQYYQSPEPTQITPSTTTSTSYKQGYPITDDSVPTGYNQPSRVDTTGMDFILSGSYLYWQGKEDHLNLAEDTITIARINDRKTIDIDFDYTSAFKVGLGVQFKSDDWQLYADYTRVHETSSTNYTALASHNLIPHWFVTNDANLNITTGSWEYKYDILTLSLTRYYYVGKKLSLGPSLGLKGGWFDQNLLVTYSNRTARKYTTDAQTKSWLIGTRLKLDTVWLLGAGFKFIGHGGFTLFQQKFTTNKALLSDPSSTTQTTRNFDNSDISFIKPNLELLLGIGWGTYAFKKKMHFDISAAYELEYYWKQNLMRNLVSRNITANSFITGLETNGDFSMHGLTTTLKVDF